MKLNAKFLTAVKKIPVAAIALIGLSSSINAYAWHPSSGDFSWNGRITTSPSYSSGDGGSGLQVITSEDWEFRIDNRTNYKVVYKINGEDYLLDPHMYRDHSYPRARGSNTNNIRNHSKPTIEFDSDANSLGWQTNSYNVGNNKFEYFRETYPGRVDLFHDS